LTSRALSLGGALELRGDSIVQVQRRRKSVFDPQSGRPVTHWTLAELADEAMKRGVVESIPPRHVDRVPKEGISVHKKVSIG